jgi:uncharacterized protein YwgA
MCVVRERLQRLEVLAHVIEEGTRALPWCGNVALQKLVYLLQSMFGTDLGYQYGLHYLGPYSPDLADDLNMGQSAGRWEAWSETFPASDGTIAEGKHFQVPRKSVFPKEVNHAAEEEWERIKHSVEAICAGVRGFISRDLELVATLHYLKHSECVDDEQLPDVLIALKPKFRREDVSRGLNILAVLESRARS